MKIYDTSVLIDYLRRGELVEGAISVITLIEVLRGVPQHKRKRVKELLERIYEVIGIDNDVIMKYCELYTSLKHMGQLIPDADLLIASTSISRNYVLVTKDKDFERLRSLGLKLELH
ncbi:type II toxin-antitoxin system VapC family toxin [Staphylothermus hellenicus]|uniref:PilT protein domain protein n=1 Tax=Staphylothermus hellenicus (strain DSM 12710 / JCM 10830 / BK20S6-10-b1 / P8) TaxID=591019 RepID=D7DC16_STAHD|nr:type II toxin-antitoxin system VapC family toxin [Staphylothermus hellenicus]ADI31713.1 PilT protein domain protein [Staphylothermus hellenicus DSM 12710]